MSTVIAVTYALPIIAFFMVFIYSLRLLETFYLLTLVMRRNRHGHPLFQWR